MGIPVDRGGPTASTISFHLSKRRPLSAYERSRASLFVRREKKRLQKVSQTAGPFSRCESSYSSACLAAFCVATPFSVFA